MSAFKHPHQTKHSMDAKNIPTYLDIQKAHTNMAGVLHQTPMLKAPYIGDSVYLKLENLQISGSFKSRGAFVKLNSLSENEKKCGIVTISIGNYAQALAYYAKSISINLTIVMPVKTPFLKIENIKKLGASVILEGDTMEESRDFALQLVKKHNYTFIENKDDPYFIAGYGTIGIEMLQDCQNLDVIIVPIGGGSLAAGICIAAKTINPNIQILGVQTQYCHEVAKILFPNTTVFPNQNNTVQQTLSETIAIHDPGILCMDILRKYLDDMLIVSEENMAQAVELLAIEGHIVAEGMGASGVAAFMLDPNIFKNRKVGIVVSGGNIDPKVFSKLIVKDTFQSGHLVKYCIQATDSSGILGKVSKIITKQGGNIFEISHQRIFNENVREKAYIYALIETTNNQHVISIQNALIQAGLPTYVIEE